MHCTHGHNFALSVFIVHLQDHMNFILGISELFSDFFLLINYLTKHYNFLDLQLIHQ